MLLEGTRVSSKAVELQVGQGKAVAGDGQQS